jgi:hypothetical protein
MKLLDDGLLPDCRHLYPWGRLHVHLSAGWSHISYSKVTQEHLDEEVSEFIKMWDSLSHDCWKADL